MDSKRADEEAGAYVRRQEARFNRPFYRLTFRAGLFFTCVSDSLYAQVERGQEGESWRQRRTEDELGHTLGQVESQRSMVVGTRTEERGHP